MQRNGRFLAALMLVAAACSSGDEAAEQPSADDAEPAAMAESPDTTDAALWAHLQDEGYTSWALWPGKGELYEGVEPHGMLLTTYVNALALDALTNGSGSMPGGAVIVKENYTPEGTLAAITVMKKVPGYAPEHADWFWAKYFPDGTAEVSGRVEMCQVCHSAQRSADYLFTARPQ